VLPPLPIDGGIRETGMALSLDATSGAADSGAAG